MPITYTIRTDLKLIIITHAGIVADDEFLQTYYQLSIDDKFDISYNRLVDVRKSDSRSRSTDALRKLAVSSEKKHEGVQPKPKTAVITSGDLAFGLARMYSALSSDASRELAVFKSLEDGLAWLGVPADILPGNN